jgi:hypothetical protein
VIRLFVLAILATATLTPSVHAQAWARKMFQVTSHDFGTVARGAKAEYVFEMQNIFEEDIHIASVRTSCTCTEPEILKDTLKTWEKGGILAKFRTRSFLGNRSATLTVTIDRPYFAEVQLSVRGYIRGDVVFNPGEVSFGEVAQGEKQEQIISVVYAGRSTWQIADVRSANEHFEVELLDETRYAGQVTYKMLVRLLDTAPAGYIQDQLTIITNDSWNKSLDLPVTGRVTTPLTVSPASLFMGVLEPGQSATKRLVVKGNKPFKVIKVNCPDGCFEFQPSDQEKAIHLIPVKFTAGESPGQFSETIEIETNLGNGLKAKCNASVTIKEKGN